MPPIAQYVFNGIVTGGILALPAVAFSLLWRLLRFPNFAVSTYLTVGAFAAFAFNRGVGWPIEAAWLAALATTGAVALAVDRVAFRPMRNRRPFALAIASIGIAFVLENVVRFVWGNDYRSYDVPVTRAMNWAGLRVGREQLAYPRGRGGPHAARAGLPAQDTPRHRHAGHRGEPAARRIKGVPTERVIALATLGGGALAGGAGVFLGLDANVDPLWGAGSSSPSSRPPSSAGIGSAPGALAGALIVGLIEEVGTLLIPPTYKTAIGFFVILIVLLVRPTGLAGARA